MRIESLPKTRSQHLTIEILTGDQAHALFSDKCFLHTWDVLYESCFWATVYQAKEFITTWYKIYSKKYLPIVVKETIGDKLTGFLPLAKDQKGMIVGAGASQAEYQGWLSCGDDGRFIKSAFLKVKKQFPGSDIQLKFIPGETPLQWVETKDAKKYFRLRTYPQPLMAVDENITQELRKKKKRKKINGLKNLGELSFERITDIETFRSVFDELAVQYDFRKAAMYNKMPFRKDPLKKKFLLALFGQNILHATVLKLNNEIIASNVAAIGRRWMHLQGINTHSPCYARYSPGILHFLFLGHSLIDEGFEILDLTPGGNSYKENLATKHILTYELSIPGSIKFYIREFRENLFHRLITHKKKILDGLTKIGVQPKDVKTGVRRINIVKEKIQKFREQGLDESIAQLLKGVRLNKKKKVYKLEQDYTDNTIAVRKNDLNHLLTYQSKGAKLTRWEFLCAAMQKMEKEDIVYSVKEETTLMNCVWITEQENKNENICPSLIQEYSLPDDAVILYDFYSHPNAKNDLKTFISSVVKEIACVKNGSIYAVVDSGDKLHCKVLEEVGFVTVPKKDSLKNIVSHS